MAMPMPRIMFVVKGSPNISVPTRMAVIGSNTPSTEAFVAPILRVAMASIAVDTTVGNRANPTKQTSQKVHSFSQTHQTVRFLSESSFYPSNL